MEFIDGIDLSKLVKQQGPLPVAQACDYIYQAALGLQHAHQQGLVHRDIKPSNLILTAPGRRNSALRQNTPPAAASQKPVSVVKILDLGLARLNPAAGGEAATGLTASNTLVGTPDFISPEQAMNAKNVDGRADIYSLGCTLYYLLTGRPPFVGESMTEKLLKHHLEEPAAVEGLRPDVPPALAVLLRKMMAKKPQDRFATPAELAQALELFAAGGTAIVAAPLAVPVPARPLAPGEDTIPEAGGRAAVVDTSRSLPGVPRP
jgi:serine/threonine-protein kinase